jgi:hypothetical protein
MKEDSIIKEAFALRRQLAVLEYALATSSDAEAYCFFKVPRTARSPRFAGGRKPTQKEARPGWSEGIPSRRAGRLSL